MMIRVVAVAAFAKVDASAVGGHANLQVTVPILAVLERVLHSRYSELVTIAFDHCLMIPVDVHAKCLQCGTSA
jgi:hypothetical protein